MCFIFLGSVVFYATVKQVRGAADNSGACQGCRLFPCLTEPGPSAPPPYALFPHRRQDDKENWGQSLYGIAVSAVGLLISLFVALRRSRRSYAGCPPFAAALCNCLPLCACISSSPHLADLSGSYAVDAYAVNAADDSSEADERRPLLGMGSTPEWARRSSPAAVSRGPRRPEPKHPKQGPWRAGPAA